MNTLEKDLKKVLGIISYQWNIQNNYFDKKTDFIYKMNSLEECLAEIEKTGVNKNYALHRWYNYMTSICCEYIFCEYGAVHEINPFNRNVDIYINSVPFDVKLTVYLAKLFNKPYDLETRSGKNDMIRWYYANQSQQNRKQLVNRLYVVCDSDTPQGNIAMKSDFELMREKISNYMDQVKKQGLNEIIIKDYNREYCVKSDIVHLY